MMTVNRQNVIRSNKNTNVGKERIGLHRAFPEIKLKPPTNVLYFIKTK